MKKIRFIIAICALAVMSCTKSKEAYQSQQQEGQGVFIRVKANNLTGTSTYSEVRRVTLQ